MVTISIYGEKKEVPQGTTFEQIAEDYQEKYDGLIAVAAANGKIRELFKKVTKDCQVEFFTLRDDVGHKTYVRTATMLLLKAVYDVFGADAAQECRVEFAIGHGYYINPIGRIPSTEENAERIRARMKELVCAKVPFRKRSYSLEDAMELFAKHGMTDKEKLFRYRMSSTVNVYEIEGYYDYYYGYMLPHTGYVKWFEVIPYEDGFMLLLPQKKDPTTVEPFHESRKLFGALKSSGDRGRLKRPDMPRLPERADFSAGGSAGTPDQRDRKGYCRTGKCEVYYDCRTYLFRQDQFFPPAFHSAENTGKGAPSHRT